MPSSRGWCLKRVRHDLATNNNNEKQNHYSPAEPSSLFGIIEPPRRETHGMKSNKASPVQEMPCNTLIHGVLQGLLESME